MTGPQQPDTDQLISWAACGDASAVEQLLTRHRERLVRMVTVRMDDRLSSRVDPSDVVQEALATASQQLSEYLRDRSMAFYPWLRQIAWNRLVDLHRRHILAGKRSVDREEPLGLSDTSAMQLAHRLLASGSHPVSRVLREELRARVKSTLARLGRMDREILILRHLEDLPPRECAAVLGISQEATKKRYVRAVRRLRRLLDNQ